MIDAHRISKSIDGRILLADVSLQCAAGEATVVIGPNGAGKSSLIRCLSLTDYPDSGSIRIADKNYLFPVAKEHGLPREPWPELSVVFQSLHLWPHLSLRDNILLPVRKKGVSEHDSVFKELVSTFHLAAVLGHRPNQASGGECQRAAIVRALLLQPQILLLDEPTSASDVEHSRTLLTHLKSLKDRGMVLVVVTHLIGFARQLADRVVFMENAQVVVSGSADMLVHPENERLSQFISVS